MTNDPAGRPPDPLRRWVAAALSGSMGLAMTIVAAGVVLGAVSGRGLELPPDTPRGLLPEIAAGAPGSVVLLGLLLLTLAPLAQIAAAATAFARLGERRYLVISVAVALMLAGSIAVAAGVGAG